MQLFVFLIQRCLTVLISLCSMNSEQAVRLCLFGQNKLQQSLWKHVPPSSFSCNPVAVTSHRLTSLIACISSSQKWRNRKQMVCLLSTCYHHSYSFYTQFLQCCINSLFLNDCYLHYLSVCLKAVCSWDQMSWECAWKSLLIRSML